MAEQRGTGRRTGRPPVSDEAMDTRVVARAPKDLIDRSNTALGDLGTTFSALAREVLQFVVDHPELLARVQAKAAADDVTVSWLLAGMLESYAPPTAPPE